jgi:hypothetical protein
MPGTDKWKPTPWLALVPSGGASWQLFRVSSWLDLSEHPCGSGSVERDRSHSIEQRQLSGTKAARKRIKAWHGPKLSDRWLDMCFSRSHVIDPSILTKPSAGLDPRGGHNLRSLVLRPMDLKTNRACWGQKSVFPTYRGKNKNTKWAATEGERHTN